MSQSIALIVTTVITFVLFHLIDWLCWGTGWVKRKVFPFVPKEIWRCSTDSGQPEVGGLKAGKRALFLGALVTTFVAIVFVPMVWLIGPQFANAPRAILLALLLWAVFDLPGALCCGIYYRFPASYVKLQAFAGLLRVGSGVVLVTWLLTVFNAW